MTQDQNEFFYWLRDDYLDKLIDTSRPITKDIPKWFGRARYEPLQTASKACWYEQLLIRKALIYGLSAGHENSYLRGLIPELLDRTRAETIIDLKDRQKQFFIGGAELTTMKSSDKERKEFAKPVQKLTPLAAIHRLLNLPDRARTHAFKSVEDHFYGHSDFTEFYTDLNRDKKLMWPLDSYQRDGMINLQIDPYAPMQVVLDQVESLVKAEQKKLKNPHGFSPKEIHDLGIPHFLDLTIWAMEEKKRIPYPEMAKIIYDDNTKTGEVKSQKHITQTTAPKALEILSADYLRRLHREIYS